MPELPEVETVKNTLKSKILNKKIKEVNVLYEGIIEYPNVEEFIEKIKNQTINDIKRYGKWLIFELDNYSLLSHLRMEGKYNIKNIDDAISKHEHVIFKLDDISLRYNDTRKFGKMHLIKKEDLYKSRPLCDLGLEPWDKKLTKEYLYNIYSNKKLPIKQVLLDQSIIVGIGNIYADEILFLSNINPLTPCNLLKIEELDKIINNTKKILEQAILKGGTTIKSFSSSGIHGRFQQELLVHTKSICPKCNNKIEKIRVAGRGTYYCSICQTL
ncbi:MAG: DNA-formamidopyrimidine glycosylase [Bacilli bacterium]|nr:DNA-formamidopyrimidine glycosylase [Bacilli bacterium]